MSEHYKQITREMVKDMSERWEEEILDKYTASHTCRVEGDFYDGFCLVYDRVLSSEEISHLWSGEGSVFFLLNCESMILGCKAKLESGDEEGVLECQVILDGIRGRIQKLLERQDK
tara:strand:- start:708 stop:1055 length:348 start_codon:yes stop_codon:yes gene_type:complete